MRLDDKPYSIEGVKMKRFGSPGMVARTWFVVVFFLGLSGLAGIAHSAALFGTATAAGDGVLQEYDHEFRWSLAHLPFDQRRLTVQYDTTFLTTFGNTGKQAVDAAFNTWKTQLANNAFMAGNRNMGNPVPNTKFDLESTAAHEIGHGLGLDHPEEGNLIMRNFEPKPDGFPWLNNTNVPPLGNEVMKGTLAQGVRRRDLTVDDWAGIKYLYDPFNEDPPVMPEPMLDPADEIPGIGELSFVIGVDTNVIDRAIVGTELGQNIDIFAVPFNVVFLQMNPEGPMGDTDNPGGQKVRRYFRGPQGELLALTVVHFSSRLGTDGPGIIDGTPDEVAQVPDGRIVAGEDIFFNTLMIPWHVVVPEPSTWLLLGSGLAGLAAWKRRKAA